jgi:hypothetical protein
MPKIDPVTGCTVMTMPEFLNDMAEKEGKGRCGGDILEDIFSDMERSDRDAEKEIAKDKATILKSFQSAVEYDDYEDRDYPIDVLEVLEVNVHSRFDGGDTRIRARVEVKSGGVRVGVLTESYWAGTRLDPPEEDVFVEWEN